MISQRTGSTPATGDGRSARGDGDGRAAGRASSSPDGAAGNAPLLERYSKYPVLTGRDFPASSGIVRVFNSGVVRFRDRYLMACRVEDRALRNRIWLADSSDGYRFEPRPEAVPLPHADPEFAEYTRGMYYDPRITEIDGVFYLVHAAHSEHGCRLSLVKTE